MRNVTGLAVIALGVMASTGAQAAVHHLVATGQVTNIRLHDYDTQENSTIEGLIAVGDTFRLFLSFDTSKAIQGSADLGPETGFYFLQETVTRVQAGNYVSVYGPRFLISSSLQLWNDRFVTIPMDAQSFELTNSFYNGPYPFDLNKGENRSETVRLSSFDWTATARNSVSISEISPSSAAFNSIDFQYAFSSSDAGQVRQAVFVTIGSVAWDIARVPEPSTWAMMIAGFGLVGAGLRARRRREEATGQPIA